jgi:hypothetical protein
VKALCLPDQLRSLSLTGGRTVYFGELGEDSKTLISYFERNGAKPCPPEANPADWMLRENTPINNLIVV